MSAKIWNQTQQAMEEAAGKKLFNSSEQAFEDSYGKVWNQEEQAWEERWSPNYNLYYNGKLYNAVAKTTTFYWQGTHNNPFSGIISTDEIDLSKYNEIIITANLISASPFGINAFILRNMTEELKVINQVTKNASVEDFSFDISSINIIGNFAIGVGYSQQNGMSIVSNISISKQNDYIRVSGQYDYGSSHWKDTWDIYKVLLK